MLQGFCAWLFFKVLAFSSEEVVEKPDKFVIALAPHTSNWDFLIGLLYCYAEGFRCNYVMKSEWFFWPLSCLLRKTGGIPVRRNKHNNLTDQLAEIARKSETFHLCITPEGTRKLQPEWKKGFYYIALKADIPILLCGLDYKQKLISCTKIMHPTGDVETEMLEVKKYFNNFQGKHPKQFTTGV